MIKSTADTSPWSVTIGGQCEPPFLKWPLGYGVVPNAAMPPPLLRRNTKSDIESVNQAVSSGTKKMPRPLETTGAGDAQRRAKRIRTSDEFNPSRLLSPAPQFLQRSDKHSSVIPGRQQDVRRGRTNHAYLEFTDSASA